jgi:uncharacterized protein YgiM (DUF1202 family)
VSRVFKNGQTQIDFVITAPTVNGDYSEKFNLSYTEDGQDKTIDGSGFEAKVTVTGGSQAQPQIQVIVKQTPTGYLNVREGPGQSYAVISRILPGQTFVFLEEGIGWVKIRLNDGSEGWVSSTYVEKK